MNDYKNKKLRPIYLLLAIGLTIIPLVLMWSTMSTAQEDGVPFIPGEGYLDFSYFDQFNGKQIIKDPTGTKAESKLWWNDGYWWASMYVPGTNAFFIHRLQWGTQTWVNTGIQLDDTRDPLNPKNVKADTLWDDVNQKLYVLSHDYGETPGSVSEPNSGRLYRYSYDALGQTYSLDLEFQGPPYVTVNRAKTETLILDKDSTGRLWTTYTGRTATSSTNNAVFVNASAGGGLANDSSWGTPFPLPSPVPVAATEVFTGDVSTLVAYKNQIAVAWTNQTETMSDTLHLALHPDSSSPESGWQYFSTPMPAGAHIDDHLSAKSIAVSSDGQLFIAVKLHGDGPNDPEIGVFALDTDGTFSFHEYSTAVDNDTRPVLIIDDAANTLYVFVTGKTTGGGKICYKTLAIPGPGGLDGMGDFPAGDCGTTFIEDKANIYKNINDATSMKGNVNDLTGIVILAADDINNQVYVHNVMGDPPPVVDATGPARNAVGVALTSTITATFSKDMVAGTLTVGSFKVNGPGGPVFGTVTYNAASKTATFAANQPLAPNATYVVELTQAIQDTTGKSLNQGIETDDPRESWQFETTGPPVQFDNTGYTVNEGDVATITVILQSPSPKPVMVGYKTVAIPGQAVPGADYTPVSATLTFPAGVTSQTFNVTTLPDGIVDGQKDVSLELFDPVNGGLGVPSTALLSIFDNEALTVRFQNATYSVNEGDGTATIEVTLSPVSVDPVTVKFSTQDGTATAGEDYTAVVNQEIIFAPGDTSKTVQVTILEDNLNELNETVNLILSDPVPGDTHIANSPATLIILDNDPEPSVKFSSGKYSVDEAGGKVTLEVRLSAKSGREVTVKYGTGGGSATPGIDYEPTNGTLTFAKGETVQSFEVKIIDDKLPDEGETFNVGLSDPDGAALGTPASAEVAITGADIPSVYLPIVIQ